METKGLKLKVLTQYIHSQYNIKQLCKLKLANWSPSQTLLVGLRGRMDDPLFVDIAEVMVEVEAVEVDDLRLPATLLHGVGTGALVLRMGMGRHAPNQGKGELGTRRRLHPHLRQLQLHLRRLFPPL